MSTSALVPASSAPTAISDPTIELNAALQDFENVLNQDQRISYQTAARPDAEAVTLFVAEIAATNQGAHGRYLWKRLCPFLEATRQFTGIVTTFVNSNPPIAALVWGGIRITLHAATGATSFFEQVTSLLMEVGRLSPTFTEFGRLYVNHIGLQHALCTYYTVVIRLCTKIVKVVQRNPFSHLFSTFFIPFEAEFKSVLEDLAQAKDSIRDQISLAANEATAESSKILAFESKENEKHRRFMGRFRADFQAENQQMDEWRRKQVLLYDAKLRDRAKEHLSSINYLKAWRLALQPRIAGTAEWWCDNASFQQWIADSKSSNLWCPGIMGAGKTVFVASFIADLLQRKGHDDVIAFHFCRADNAGSLEARSIIGTLARQILDSEINGMTGDDLQKFYQTCKCYDTKDIVNLLVPRLDISKTYFIIVDGLDECNDSDFSDVRNAIAKITLEHSGIVKTLFSTRPEFENHLFGSDGPRFKAPLSKSQVQDDIHKYVDTTLDKCLEEEILILRDPTLIVKITKTLKKGSNGMFLWARLFIGELCACVSDYEISEALEHLPRELAKLLNTILTRVKGHTSKEHAMRTLSYCGITKRPLTTHELQEALSIREGQKSLDRSKMPTNVMKIISACRGLVFVDEVDDTVHYVHHCLKMYLFNELHNGMPEFQEAELESLLGAICLTYLNFSDFQRQIAKTYSSSALPVAPLVLGAASTTRSNKMSKWIARKLIDHQKHLHSLSLQELSRQAQDLAGITSSARLQQELQARVHPFLEYAKIYWLHHTTKLDISDTRAAPHTGRLFVAILESEKTVAQKPWLNYHGDPENRNEYDIWFSTVEWAIQNNHYPLLQYQLTRIQKFADLPGLADLRQWTLARQEYVQISKLLCTCQLRSGESFYNILDEIIIYENDKLAVLMLEEVSYDRTRVITQAYLSKAAFAGMPRTVAKLLEIGAVTDAPDEDLPLEQAVKRPDNYVVVDLLLNAGANVHLNHGPCTALEYAITHGDSNVETVDRLLRVGAKIFNDDAVETSDSFEQQNAVDSHLKGQLDILLAEEPLYRKYRLLTKTILAGHVVLSRCLIQAGADVRRGDSSLLGIACSKGHLDIVTTLLRAGADANLQTFGRSPLAYAIAARHDGVVESLFANGAKLDSSDPALLNAIVRSGYVKGVELMLQKGVDLNLEANFPPVLQLAVWCNNEEIVKMLIAAGADIDRVEIWSTALIQAASLGFCDILKLLIEAGADVNLIVNGLTALHYAISANSLDCIKILMEAGARTALIGDHTTALIVAVRRAGRSVVQFLVEVGENVNAIEGDTTALIEAVQHASIEVVEYLLKVGADVNAIAQDTNALIAAVRLHKTDYVKCLVEVGCDVNAVAGHTTALFEAALAYPMTSDLEYLVGKGVDINAVVNGHTVLIYAIRSARLLSAEFLVNAGAQVDAIAANTTALCEAVKFSHYNTAMCLLTAGADVNLAVSDSRLTALMWAAGQQDSRFTKLLLDIHTLDLTVHNQGSVALRIAIDFGNQDVERLLRQAGAGTRPDSSVDNPLTSTTSPSTPTSEYDLATIPETDPV